jgi:hypothetical protein
MTWLGIALLATALFCGFAGRVYFEFSSWPILMMFACSFAGFVCIALDEQHEHNDSCSSACDNGVVAVVKTTHGHPGCLCKDSSWVLLERLR